MKMNKMTGLLFLCGIITVPAYALNAEDLKNWDLSVAGGPTWYHASDTTTEVTTLETDDVNVTQESGAPSYRVGVGYHLLADQLVDRPFFNDLLLQLNLYHSTGAIDGQTADFGSSCCVNYAFHAPVSSTRLMVDIKPTLFTYQHLSPYAVLGAGIAWNQMSYEETPYDSVNAPGVINLASGTSRNFAYDMGFGVRGDLTAQLSATLEYLYTNLGNVAPSSTAQSQQGVLAAPSFNVSSQALLAGLSWKF